MKLNNKEIILAKITILHPLSLKMRRIKKYLFDIGVVNSERPKPLTLKELKPSVHLRSPQ